MRSGQAGYKFEYFGVLWSLEEPVIEFVCIRVERLRHDMAPEYRGYRCQA